MSSLEKAVGDDEAVQASVVLMAVASFLTMMSMRVCDPLVPAMAQQFSVSLSLSSASAYVFTLAYGFAQLLAWRLASGRNIQRVVCCMTFLCFVVTSLCALAPNIESLIVLRAVWGLAAAPIVPLSIAWVGNTFEYDKRRLPLAKLLFGTISGGILGASLGGAAASSPNLWRVLFMAMSATSLALSYKMHRSFRLEGHNSLGLPVARLQVTALLMQMNHPLILLLTFLEGVFLFGAVGFLPTYLVLTYGVEPGVAGFIAAAFGVGGLIYALIARQAAVKLSENAVVAISCMVVTIGFASLLLAQSVLVVVLSLFFLGIGGYLMHSTFQIKASELIPALRPLGISLFACVLFVGQSAGMAAASRMADNGALTPIFISALIVLPLCGVAYRYVCFHKHGVSRDSI